MDELLRHSNESLTGDDVILQILSALKEDNFSVLRELLKQAEFTDVAEILNQTEEDERAKLVAILGEVNPEIFPYLEGEVKEQIISLLGLKSSAEAIEQLESDDAVQFVEDLPEEDIEKILNELSDNKKQEIESALQFPEDSAGRLANKQFVTIRKDQTVGSTIDILRENQNLPQDFYTIFIVDENEIPVGFVPLSRIMRNKRDIKISDLEENKIRVIQSNTDQEEVANIFKKHGLISAPVVNGDGRMIGVITIDDIAYVIEEEAEEDMMNLAYVGSESSIMGSSAKKVKNRMPWLTVNLFTSFLSTIIISLFDGSIEKLVALAALMPVVASLSGISGSQALTVSVRAIASNEISFSNLLLVLKKEFFAGALNGLFIGCFVFIISFLIYRSVDLSFVLMLAIFLTFIISVVIGTSIPVILDKLKIDPAVASSSIVLAITDVSSFFIFLGLATILIL